VKVTFSATISLKSDDSGGIASPPISPFISRKLKRSCRKSLFSASPAYPDTASRRYTSACLNATRYIASSPAVISDLTNAPLA